MNQNFSQTWHQEPDIYCQIVIRQTTSAGWNNETDKPTINQTHRSNVFCPVDYDIQVTPVTIRRKPQDSTISAY